MTSARTFILFAGDAECRVATCAADADGPSRAARPAEVPIPAAAGASPEQAAAAAVAALSDAVPLGAAITLAVPSHWCLCASVDAAGLPPSSRRQALLYRLEEKLPLAAEDVVADFVPGGVGKPSLGVAVPLRKLGPLVRTIEAAGWVVEVISPAALLAAQAYVTAPGFPACDGLLFEHAGHLELVLIGRDARVTDWDVLPADADDVAMELGLRSLRMPPPLRLACAGVPPDVVARLREIAQLGVAEVELPPPEQAAADAARSVAAGGAAPWVQLRRDALGAADPYRPARRAMNAALVAAVVFCACLCGALAWRAAAYERLAAEREREQGEVFARVFDGRRPADGLDVSSRLASEERRLRTLAGEAEDMPAWTSAVAVLQRVLARLPADARCRIDELRVADGNLYLEGTAPSHADAAAFAAALASEPGFTVDAPNTEQLASGDGVMMQVTGAVSAAAAAFAAPREVRP